MWRGFNFCLNLVATYRQPLVTKEKHRSCSSASPSPFSAAMPSVYSARFPLFQWLMAWSVEWRCRCLVELPIFCVLLYAQIIIWMNEWMNEWTDTSLRYRHWRMCFERLLQAFARWQPGYLFDIAAQPIFEYSWIASYSQQFLRTQFKVATVYSIHTQSLSWCSTGLVPNVLPRRDEGSGKPCAVDRAS